MDKITRRKVLLLGLGMQGEAALYDLIKCDELDEVIAGDISLDFTQGLDEEHLESVRFVEIDANDEDKISELMNEVDLVIEFLPPGFTYSIAELAVENGVDLVSTMYLYDPAESDSEEQNSRKKHVKELENKAEKRDLTILPEFGLDPGIDLVLASQAVQTLDRVDELHCYGAGLPVYEDADNFLKYIVLDITFLYYESYKDSCLKNILPM